jgi:hypothetical protein
MANEYFYDLLARNGFEEGYDFSNGDASVVTPNLSAFDTVTLAIEVTSASGIGAKIRVEDSIDGELFCGIEHSALEDGAFELTDNQEKHFFDFCDWNRNYIKVSLEAPAITKGLISSVRLYASKS